jgi:polyhydroxyalkanoate synthesis regulator phasin
MMEPVHGFPSSGQSNTNVNQKERTMVTIKKYANGRFYDTDKKKYLKKEEVGKLVASRKKVRVVFSKTGEDITASLKPKTKAKTKAKAKKATSKSDVRARARKTTKQVSDSVKKWAEENKKWIRENKKWLSDNLDKRINKMLKVMNLPTKDQVAKLDKNLRALNKKVKELEALQAKKFKALEKAQKS